MNTDQLRERILEMIKDLYNAEFNGYIKVIKNTETSYSLILGLPTYLEPTAISCDAESDEQFLQFVEDELKRRNYMRVYIYKVIRSEDPENRTFVPKEPEIKTNKEFIEENGFPITLE